MPTHYYICAHLGFLHVCHRLTRYRRNADRATFSSSTSVCSLSFDDADCFMSFASLFSSDTEAATSSLCCSFISKDTSSILCVRMDVVLALLVSTIRAMRRPLWRGTSDRIDSTLFRMYKSKLLTVRTGAIGHNYVSLWKSRNFSLLTKYVVGRN